MLYNLWCLYYRFPVILYSGCNCRSSRSGAVHSSLHTTLSVLEGIAEYERNVDACRLDELKRAQAESEEFILQHQCFLSDRAGEVIHTDFLRIPYPCRWRYDILRALDCFQYVGRAGDNRRQPAMDVLIGKRRKDQLWPFQAKHLCEVHFEMETAGKASRWNTFRAMRVLKQYGNA